MGIRSHGRFYLSRDKRSYWEEVNGTITQYVRGVAVASWTSSGQITGLRALVRAFNGYSKVGGTAGWTVGGGAVNTGKVATMAASQTAGKLVFPIPELPVGATITAFYVIGSIQSVGGAVTLDADLRMLANASAGGTDSSLGTITQIAVTAATAVNAANGRKVLATPQVFAADASIYALITGTTAASTTAEILGVAIEYTLA